MTIDCPADCSYLVAAHRYEAEHREPIPASEFPYKDVEFSVEYVYERWPVIAGIATAILGVQAQQRDLRDSDVRAAIERLAETYRTLGTGIYYERPPEAPLPLAVYGEIGRFLQDFRKAESEHAGFTSVKDADVFRLLVFLLRLEKAETSGRSRSRAFIEFLRTRFPAKAGSGVAASEAEAPRIIIP